MKCTNCDQDISDTYEEYDPSVGITAGGWYCDRCDLFIPDWEADTE